MIVFAPVSEIGGDKMEVGTAIEIMLAFGIYTLALLTYVKNDRKK